MPNQTNKSGFTLIEVLIGASLTLVIGASIVGLVVILGQNRVEVLQSYINVEGLNSNLTTMIREVRNARPGNNGAYTLAVAQDQEFVFYSDVDFDGETERVRYTLNGTDLQKGVTEPSGFPITYDLNQESVRVVGENIRNGVNPIFYYYNGDWPEDTVNNPLPSPIRLSETKLMQISLRVNDIPNDADNDFVLESYVQLRSLKQNL